MNTNEAQLPKLKNIRQPQGKKRKDSKYHEEQEEGSNEY